MATRNTVALLTANSCNVAPFPTSLGANVWSGSCLTVALFGVAGVRPSGSAVYGPV